MSRRFAPLLLCLCELGRAEEPPDQYRLLGQLREQARARFARVAQFTCLQTAWRTEYDAKGKIRFSDQVRIEVGSVDGKEVFGYPGGALTAAHPGRLVRIGASSNGELLEHAATILVEQRAGIHYEGLQDRRGAHWHQFRYEVPLLQSSFEFATVSGRATIAYGGRFWIAPQSLALRELLIESERIPVTLGMRRIATTLLYDEYDESAPLTAIPRSATTVLDRWDGSRAVSSSIWSQCLSFQTESRLLADGEGDKPAAPTAAPQRPQTLGEGRLWTVLPAGLRDGGLELGQTIALQVERDAAFKGGVRLTVGTPVLARIVRLERQTGPQPQTVVGLTLETVRLGERLGRFTADVERVDAPYRAPVFSAQIVTIRMEMINGRMAPVRAVEKNWLPESKGMATLVLPADGSAPPLRIQWHNRNEQEDR